MTRKKAISFDDVEDLQGEIDRLRDWLRYIRWGVGFYEAKGPTRDRVLESVDAALSGEPSPPGMTPALDQPPQTGGQDE